MIDAFMGSVVHGSDLVFYVFLVLSIKQGFSLQNDSASIIFNGADLMNLMRMNSKGINVLGNQELSGEYPAVCSIY